MDRVVVARHAREEQEVRVGERSRRALEAIADREVLEVALGRRHLTYLVGPRSFRGARIQFFPAAVVASWRASILHTARSSRGQDHDSTGRARLAGFLKHHSGMWTLIRLWVGKFLNAIGVPGIVVSQTYDAAVTRAQVRVTIGSL